jgi:arginyl-tRNA synthetase
MTENVFTAMTEQVRAALLALYPELPADILARVQVEPPRDAAHGDMATNAALVIAKPARLPPAKIAAALVERLAALPMVEAAEAAGPGFVNLRLRESYLVGQVALLLGVGEAYGDSAIGAGRRVNVEYVSANPTGPMHVGHCRGAVVGDALANLLGKAGFAVTKEYYVNDAGAQVVALSIATYWRYLQILNFSESAEHFEDQFLGTMFRGTVQYRGDYLIPVAQKLHEQFGEKFRPVTLLRHMDAQSAKQLGLWGGAGHDPIYAQRGWLEEIKKFTIDELMKEVKFDLELLGVKHDKFLSEQRLIHRGETDKVIRKLEKKGLLYEGVLEPPKGKTPDDWEPRPQLLFRSTQFGDDVDRPLKKSDGSNTYFANDIACHADKLKRKYDLLIDVWGADHGGYVSRMGAAVKALSGGRVPLEVVLCQIVHVMKAGEPVRMSKRAGTYVTLRDLIEEVGRDAVRFTMLARKSDAQMEFDLDKVVEQSRENPVFYVQYAHARCRSVLRQAGEPSAAALTAAPLEHLQDKAELDLIRRLISWPRVVEAAALAREPHRIAFFLHDLAADFHVLWNRGREDSTLRFIREDEPGATAARLALVAATASVIRSGLGVMGVTPVEEMR